MRPTTAALTTALALIALLPAACGGRERAGEATADTAPSPVAAAAPAPAAPAPAAPARHDMDYLRELVGRSPDEVDLWNTPRMAQLLREIIPLPERREAFLRQVAESSVIGLEDEIIFVTGESREDPGLAGVFVADLRNGCNEVALFIHGGFELHADVKRCVRRPAPVLAFAEAKLGPPQG